MSGREIRKSVLDPDVNLVGIHSATAKKVPALPIGLGVMYKPSRLKCPECAGDTVKEYSGAWTEAAKGEKYICKVCGLEFSRAPKPYYDKKRSTNVAEISRKKAEDVVLSSLQLGKKYSLLSLQSSTEQYLRTYFTKKELEEVEVEQPVKRPMFDPPEKPITEWRFDIPKYMEKKAEGIWWDLDEQGFEIEVEIIEKKRGGNVYEYFRLTAKRKPEQMIADPVRAQTGGFQLAALPDARFCISCYRTFPIGAQVFKKGSEFLCPTCESPLRRPFDTRPIPRVKGGVAPDYSSSRPTVVGTSTPSGEVVTLRYRGVCSSCNKVHEVGDKVLAQHTQHACPVCGGIISPV